MNVDVILSMLWNTAEFRNNTTAQVCGPFAKPNRIVNNIPLSGQALHKIESQSLNVSIWFNNSFCCR